MKPILRLSLIAALVAALPMMACAEDGYIASPVTMYSGPDASYPPIETIPAGEPVSVQGCTSAYEWCDTIWGEDRGWIPGGYVEYEQNGAPVLLGAVAAAIAIPIVTFSIADYWGRYYPRRSFYAQRDTWFHRSFAHRPPPAFHGQLHNYGVHGGERRVPQNNGHFNQGHINNVHVNNVHVNEHTPAARPMVHSQPMQHGPAPRPQVNRAPPHPQQSHPAPHREAPRPAEHREEHH